MVLSHLLRLKTSVYQGTVQELPLLVGDRRLWLSWTQALCRADVVTDEFLC